MDHTICEVCSLPILKDEEKHRCPGEGHNYQYDFNQLEK
jgi:hypothetical protein